MEKIQFFLPNNLQGKIPCVLALPGIVAVDEPTRINSILEKLSKENGILGMRLNYVEREEREEVDLYRFDLTATTQDIENAIKIALTEFNASSDRIGLVSNSISALPATDYIIKNRSLADRLKLRCYVSISPLLGWNYFTNKEIRDYIERERPDLEISNGKEKKRKVIPKEMLPDFMHRDALDSLRGYKKDGMAVLTIVGVKDKKADPNSMKDYHRILGGKEKDLILLEAGHDVPNSNEFITRFLIEHLSD